MIVLDKFGWPIERIKGRPILYWTRCLLRGRKIVRKWEPPHFAPDPNATARGGK